MHTMHVWVMTVMAVMAVMGGEFVICWQGKVLNGVNQGPNGVLNLNAELSQSPCQ